jgi:hypothetical protein
MNISNVAQPHSGKRYNLRLSCEQPNTFGSHSPQLLELWGQFPEIVFYPSRTFKMNKTLVLAAVIAAAALAACGKKEEAAAPAAPAPAAAPAADASAPAADASAPAADASAAK